MYTKQVAELLGVEMREKTNERGDEHWLEVWLTLYRDEETITVPAEIPEPGATECPESWEGLAAITGVGCADVASGWRDDSHNPVVGQVVNILKGHIGRRFLCQQTGNFAFPTRLLPHDEKAIAATPVERDEPEKKRVTCQVTEVHEPKINDLEHPYLQIDHVDENGNEGFTTIMLPDVAFYSDEGGTPDYFNIEVVTNVAGAQIFDSWQKNMMQRTCDNDHARTAAKRLKHALTTFEHPLFLDKDGKIDLRQFRRHWIQSRFRHGQANIVRGQLPCFFTVWAHLQKARLWSLLRDCSGLLYRWVEGEGSLGYPAELVRSPDTGRVFIRDLNTKASFGAFVNRHVAWGKVDRRTGRPIPRRPDPQLLSEMIAEPDPSIPEVRGIMKLPVMRDDGSVAIKEGYDPVSKFYIAPELTIEELPERPTYEDVQKARAVIGDVFGEFAWKSGSHGTAAVAIVLEQVVRNMIRGARPLYAITASGHGQGSGKSLLADVCGYLIHGDRNHAGTWPENEEELKKLITTKLRQRTSYYVFDNIDKTVTSPAMAALTTSNSWSSRILGVNKEFASENMTTWVLTLNNARLSKDLARRTVIIHLDLGVARALDAQKQRTFRHDDLRAYVKDLKVRASVVRALMIFTRFWISAGKPRDTSLRFTSFTEWQNTVASILVCAGFPSVKEALEDAEERDVDEERYLNLLSYWRSKFGEQWIQAVDLARDVMAEGVIALEGKNDSWLARNLVDMIRPLTNRVYEGYIIRMKVSNGKVQFRLETVEDD